MAGWTLGDAWLWIRGDDSELEKTLDGAEGKTKSFASNATNLLGGAVAGAAVAAGAAILAIGKGALDVSVDTQEAAGNMAASLGIPIAEAEKFAEVAKRVYGNNFADSVGDAADAVGLLAQQMGLTAEDPALAEMAENAFRLRDSFGIDVADSIGTVKTLMDNFGISGTEAFDLIAAGNQKGLNASGDLLETINEYAVQFSSGGASADQFFSVMESGFSNGVLGTDKAADAFKEFRVRVQDGSALTSESLTMLGLDADAITSGLAAGTLTAADAFSMVTTALGTTSDSTTQFQAGVGLLGTQFEDLGTDIATTLTMTGDWQTASEGAISSLDAKYNTFGGAVEGIWRRLTVSISPFTDNLLGLVNDAMPAVLGAFDTFDATVGPAIETAGNTINTVVGNIKGWFSGLKTSVDENATGPLQYWKDWIDTNMPMIQTVITTVLGAIQTFWGTWGDEILGIVNMLFGNAWLVIDTTMRTIGDVITLALQLITGDWEGAETTITGIVTRIWETITSVVSTQIEAIKTLFTGFDWASAGEAIVNGVKSGINTAWEGLKTWFEAKLTTLRNMLPFSEPKDPSSPLRGLSKSGAALIKNFKGGMDEGIDSLHASFAGGLAGLAGGFGSQPQAAGAGGMNITVNVSGDNATYEGGRAVGRGIQDELRKRGRQ